MKLREYMGIPQDARARADLLGQVYYPDPDEWASPVEEFAPHADLAEAPTVQRKLRNEKTRKQELPQLQANAEHKARKIKRRASTDKI
jgi:hypothetical protein